MSTYLSVFLHDLYYMFQSYESLYMTWYIKERTCTVLESINFDINISWVFVKTYFNKSPWGSCEKNSSKLLLEICEAVAYVGKIDHLNILTIFIANLIITQTCSQCRSLRPSSFWQMASSHGTLKNIQQTLRANIWGFLMLCIFKRISMGPLVVLLDQMPLSECDHHCMHLSVRECS